MRKIEEELSSSRRIAFTTTLALAWIVIFYFGGAVLFVADGKPSASKLNSVPNPQRCGDYIYFFFDDQNGKNIDPANFESLTINDKDYEVSGPFKSERKGMKGFSRQTGCGMPEMKVKVAYQNKKMELIIKRIQGDSGDIFLYSIPFSEGTYMFDFEYNLDKNCEDKVKGWHPECIISPKRLKKVIPESSK